MGFFTPPPLSRIEKILEDNSPYLAEEKIEDLLQCTRCGAEMELFISPCYDPECCDTPDRVYCPRIECAEEREGKHDIPSLVEPYLKKEYQCFTYPMQV